MSRADARAIPLQPAAERAQHPAADRLLAVASGALLALEPEPALAEVASTLVPALAEACAFDLADGRRAAASGAAPPPPALGADAVRTLATVQRREDGRSLLAVPLVVRGRAAGALALARGADAPFGEPDVALAQEVARRVGLALDRGGAEARLRESQHRFEQVLDSVRDMVFTKGPGSTLTYANQATREHHGMTLEALRGLADGAANDRAYTAQNLLDDAEVFRSGRAVERAEEASVGADGETRWFHTIRSPVFDREGRVVEIVAVARDVTERRRQQEELARQKAILESQMEASIDGIVVLDADGRVAAANRRLEEIWGLPEGSARAADGDALARRFADLAADPDAFLARVRALRERPEETVRDEVLLRDGRALERYGAPVRTPDGRRVGVLWTFRDVTTRRRAEAALRQSEERFRLIARATNDVVRDWDLQTGAVWWSEAFEPVFGDPVASLGGDLASWTSRIHPEDAGRVVRSVEDAIRRGEPSWSCEYRFRRRDGAYAWVLDRAHVIVDTAGRPVRMVGSMLDLTERRLAEERLAGALREVERQRRRLDSIVASVPGVVWESWERPDEAAQRADFVSGNVERLLGYTAREWLATPGFWLTLVHPEDRARAAQEARRQFEGGMDGTIQFRWRRRDGTYIWAQSWNTVVLDADGRPAGMRGVTMDITARKLAEEAVRESQAELAKAQEIAHLGSWSWDLATGRIAWSDEQHRIHGVAPQAEGMTFERLLSFVHPEDRDLASGLLRGAVERAGPAEGAYRIVRPDGTIRRLHARAEAVPGPDGEPARVVGTCLDATEQHAAEQALRESEARYRFLADAVPEQVWTALADGRLDYVNRRMCEYFARSPEEIAGDGWKDALHPEDVARVEARWERSVASGEAYEAEFRLRRHDGAWRWHVARAAALRDERGRVVKWFGSSHDVSDLKDAQAALAERAEALARLTREVEYQRDLTRTITDNAASALFMIDLDGRPVFMNPAATAMTGYAGVEEIGGRTLHEAIHARRPDGSAYPREECPIDRANARAEHLKDQREVFCRRDGSTFPVQYNVAPVVKDGERLGAVVEARDITREQIAEAELRHRADELARLAAALERSNRELDQFAYVTSHDLKAPLRGIANLSRWIEEDLGEAVGPETRRHLELLRGRVHRMEALIDAILQYSRVGRVRTRPETVDAGTLVGEVVDLLAPPAGFRVQIEALPTLVAERPRLQQVFLNLVGNAIKHHHRPAEGTVRVWAEDAGDFWRFRVADDGPGIAPRYHEKVFVLFQTLEARDKVEGTGIGLALVKKIVQTQGGAVEIDSAEGRGATFSFTWPKRPAATGESP